MGAANTAAKKLGHEKDCVSIGSLHRARTRFRTEASKATDLEIMAQDFLQLGFDDKVVHGHLALYF